MLTAAQVRAKTRKTVQKRAEEIEEEEIASGEINLIPFLDITTVLMLFLLAISSASMVLGQIDTTLPDHVQASASEPADPQKELEERIQPVVSITDKGILVWSISGLEGTIQEPKAVIPEVSRDRNKSRAPRFDYQKLNDTLYEMAARRWKAQIRPHSTYEIILQADGDIPYETVIEVMDAMRRKLPAGMDPDEALPPVFMPETEEREDGSEDPVEQYDPDKHYLFPDILFSLGFE